LAGRLVELAERYGQRREGEEGVLIDLAITQEELAGWTGASREALTKALQTLRGLGWIETGRRSLRIHDLEALRDRAT
jgi:CRP-like cAMP-binding protein